jgi:AcrR family transcriptional regulator
VANARTDQQLIDSELHPTRREQILEATLDVIAERGFPDTRVADVAERADVSAGLIIYYFKTKDHLLAEAMRSAENRWYAQGAEKTARTRSAVKRLEAVVAMTFLAEAAGDAEESWTIWLDLWAASVRQTEVRRVRQEFDDHWRETIRAIVQEGQASGEFGEIDPEEFAVGFCALLDGLAVQVALEDEAVPPRRAFELSMRFAAAQLGFSWRRPRARRGR